MNSLQSLSEKRHGPVLVTLNPPFEVDEDKVVGRYKYDHPMYSRAVSHSSCRLSSHVLNSGNLVGLQSVKAQSQLPSIQNARRVTFAGAWTNYGFHEDGFTSGLKIATEIFDAKPPFPVRPASREIKKEPMARAVVMHAEAARKWMESSVAWTLVVGLMVMLLSLVEQLFSAGGLDKWAHEVRDIRGFWEDGPKGKKEQ
jgi:predicted NAD/FAD-binding protein